MNLPRTVAIIIVGVLIGYIISPNKNDLALPSPHPSAVANEGKLARTPRTLEVIGKFTVDKLDFLEFAPKENVYCIKRTVQKNMACVYIPPTLKGSTTTMKAPPPKPTKTRVLVEVGDYAIWDKVTGFPNHRIDSFGKEWVKDGTWFTYAYLTYNAIDAVPTNKKAGRLR